MAIHAKKYLSGLITIILSLGIVVPSTYLSNIPLTKAVTYTVTTNADSGAGSFRQAVIDANANPGTDTIEFTASGSITVSTTMDAITSNIIINGTTAPDVGIGPDISLVGSGSTDCLVYGSGGGGSVKGMSISGCRKDILIQDGADGVTIGGVNGGENLNIMNASVAGISIEGGSNIIVQQCLIGITGGNAIGISITGGTTITIGGAISNNASNSIGLNTAQGILVGSSTGVTITGNYIGVGNDSSTARANGGAGIEVSGTSISSLTIGGTTSDYANYISSNNSYGIVTNSGASNGVTIKNNYIGISSGGADVGNNSVGILLNTGSNTISGNVISGNNNSGIWITGAGATSNTITSNYIGVNAAGTSTVKNNNNGILIDTNASENTIINNVISGNDENGIRIAFGATGTTYIYGNKIGLGSDGTTSLPNLFCGIAANAKVIIGDATDDAKTNYIGGNNQYGIQIGTSAGSLSTIVNNKIGLGTDLSSKPNLLSGILIDLGATGVTIGSNSGTIQEINNNGQSGIVFEGASTDLNIVYKNNIKGNGLAPITTTNSAQGNTTLTVGNLTVNSSGASGTSSVYPGTMTLLAGTSSNGAFITTAAIGADGVWSLGTTLNSGENYWLYATDSSRSTATTGTGVIASDTTAPTEPTFTSSTGTVATATYTLTGTKDAYTSVFNAGTSIVSADSSTSWSSSSTSLVEGVNTFTIDSRDYTGNVSSTGTYTVTLDTIAPSVPVLSYQAIDSSATSVITGTAEASALIYLNDVYTTTVAGDGTFTVTPAIQSGTNIYNIYATDGVGNRSPVATAVVSTPTGGGGGSSGGSSGSLTQNNSSTTSETDTTTTDPGESMAGELETVTTPDTTPDITSAVTDTVTNATVTNEIIPTYTNQDAPKKNQTKTINSSNATQVETSTLKFFIPKRPPVFTTPILRLKFIGEKGKDKLPLWWKLQNFGDKSLEISPTTDTDNDGLPDTEEFIYGTDPKSEDSDKDGVLDTLEIDSGANPNSYDSDGDGITDSDEKSDEVNLFNQVVKNEKTEAKYIEDNNIELNTEDGETLGTIDTDLDGLSDQQELELGTNPTYSDSDSDGLSDGNEVLLYASNPNKSSKVAAINIGNIKKGQVNSIGKQYIMGGSNTSNVDVTIYIIDSKGKDKKIGKTKTDAKGFFSVLTSPVNEGTYSIIAVMSRGRKTLSMSYPLELNVSKTVSVSAPELEVKVDKKDVAVNGKLKDKNSKVVATWRSLVLTNTIVADQNFKLTAPKTLEAGDHTATVYTVSPIDNSHSSPVQVNFTLSTTGFASGETQGISPLITIGGSTLILLSLIALAIFRRRNNGVNGLKK